MLVDPHASRRLPRVLCSISRSGRGQRHVRWSCYIYVRTRECCTVVTWRVAVVSTRAHVCVALLFIYSNVQRASATLLPSRDAARLGGPASAKLLPYQDAARRPRAAANWWWRPQAIMAAVFLAVATLAWRASPWPARPSPLRGAPLGAVLWAHSRGSGPLSPPAAHPSPATKRGTGPPKLRRR